MVGVTGAEQAAEDVEDLVSTSGRSVWYGPLPVVMYHSVHDRPAGWIWAHLCISARAMEWQLRYLRRHGWNTVFLRDVVGYLQGKFPLPRRSIALTFDDGYLDNWVNLFPLLKKYEFKATIFVSTDFIDPGNRARATVEDVWRDGCRTGELETWGYLSAVEMKLMQDSGLVDIQSHAKTHTWYYSGDRIVDFHHPGDPYMWLAWNAYPERKPFWLGEDQSSLVAWGTPIYEHGKALVTRRYTPSPTIAHAVTAFVDALGGISFFRQDGWKRTLMQVVEVAGRERRSPNQHETEDQYRRRVFDELVQSKQVLENILGKPVEFLCWPGGGCNEITLAMAKQAGYVATTVRGRPNSPGADPTHIERVSFSRHRLGFVPADVVSFLSWVQKINAYKHGRLAIVSLAASRAVLRSLRLLLP